MARAFSGEKTLGDNGYKTHSAVLHMRGPHSRSMPRCTRNERHAVRPAGYTTFKGTRPGGGLDGEAGLLASNLDGYRDAAGGLHGVLRTNIMKLSNCILTLAAQEAQIAHAFAGVRENVKRTLWWGLSMRSGNDEDRLSRAPATKTTVLPFYWVVRGT